MDSHDGDVFVVFYTERTDGKTIQRSREFASHSDAADFVEFLDTVAGIKNAQQVAFKVPENVSAK